MRDVSALSYLGFFPILLSRSVAPGPDVLVVGGERRPSDSTSPSREHEENGLQNEGFPPSYGHSP